MNRVMGNVDSFDAIKNIRMTAPYAWPPRKVGTICDYAVVVIDKGQSIILCMQIT
jgi:hypothetical protein